MSLPFEMDPETAQKQQEEVKEKLTYERRKRKSNHKGRMPLPEHLPVEEIEIYPSEDTTDMVCIGKEVTEELEYKPAIFYIKRYIRYKYAPKSKEGVVIGELPNRVIEKGIPGAGLLAWILTCKYLEHLPLYRLLQRFKREKIPVASSTLEGWTRQALKIIDNNIEAPSLIDLIISPDIYIPLIIFVLLVFVTIFLRKIFYKN